MSNETIITALVTTVAALAGAVVYLFKAYRSEARARLRDKDRYAKLLEELRDEMR